MPFIEDLYLFHLDNSAVAAAWAAMGGKRGATVKHLTLCDVRMEDVQFKVAQTFPNILSLSLGAGMEPIFPTLIAADEACVTSGDAAVWSLLECLTLMQILDESLAGLVQSFIRGRKAVGYPIKKVVFTEGEPPASTLLFVREHVFDVTIQQPDEDSDSKEYTWR